METDMTKFVRDQFSYWGGYLTYGPERLFIARFKYASTSSKPRWITFMCKNFTVESGRLRALRTRRRSTSCARRVSSSPISSSGVVRV